VFFTLNELGLFGLINTGKVYKNLSVPRLVEGYKKADIPKIVVLNSGLEEGYELLMDQNTRAVIIDDWSIFECIKKHYNYAKLEKQKDQNHGKLILSEINLPVFIRDDIEGITHFIKCCFCN
jgi:hypothetical protein